MTSSPAKLKLYIGCSLTQAPQDFILQVETLKDSLRDTYEVFDFVGLEKGTAADVYNWDIGHCVATCDLFLAICDYPSLGLGWELNEAINLGKPVLGVAHTDALITRLVLGATEVRDNFTFARYQDITAEIPHLLVTLAQKLK